MPSYPVRMGAANTVLKERMSQLIRMNVSMQSSHVNNATRIPLWPTRNFIREDLPKGRNPLPSKMQKASEKVWSQSVVHYHFKLKNEILFMCVTKPSGVGMQFLVLEFLSSAQLDHTSMYNFENCS